MQDTAKRGSIRIQTSDTLKTDSANAKTASGLTSNIEYSAQDSIRFNVDKSTIHLYGKGRIHYEDLELDAEYIRIDQKQKLLFASGLNDKKNVYRGRPIFKQGSDEPVTTDSVVFNFETKKGKAYGTATSMDGGYIQASQFKKNKYDEGFIKDGMYSTCNLPEPHTHFGIHITKGIITDKQVVSGPAYLVIEHIPTPLGVPFGFFPKTNKRASGFRFPSFGEDATRGFYMNGIGWYLGINDYWDADITGTLYSKGSYSVSTIGRYRKNYKHNGSVNLSYAETKDPNAIKGTPDNKAAKDFRIQWSHVQDNSANPGTTFGASVNFGTSKYYRNTNDNGYYNIRNLTNNSMSSSINYGTTFIDGLFNFTTTLSHRQDLNTGMVGIDFPSYNLSMSTLNPFDRKDRAGEQKWYQRISVGYSSQGTNRIDTKDSLLFKKETLKKLQSGIQHSIPVSLNLNVLKVLNFNTSVNYNERWAFQTIRRYYDPSASNQVATDTVTGFKRNYDYGVSGGFSTKLYGMATFKKGRVVALRHVVTPTASFSYRPDFSSSRFGFYKEIEGVPQDLVTDPTSPFYSNRRYSVFENSPSGGPGSGRSASLSFSIDNNIEAKVRAKTDTGSVYEKIPIIEGLSFSSGYNFAAESFKLSPINFSGRTSFFKQKMGVNFGGEFDPYQVERNGSMVNRVDRYTFADGKFPRLSRFFLSTNFNFNSAKLKERNDNLRDKQEDPGLTPSQQQDVRDILNNPNYFVDFNVPWNISASYSMGYYNNGVTKTIDNTLNFNGDFSLTPKWKIAFNSGFDFKANKFSTTDFSIHRDLHCWDLSFRWVPFGMYKSYSVDLRVRSSILQDLKITKRSASPLNTSF